MTPEERFAAVHGALLDATRVRMAAGALLIEGFIGFARGTSGCPLDLLVVPPGLLPTESLTERLVGGEELDEAIRTRQLSLPGDRLRALEQLGLSLREALSLLDQADEIAEEVRTTAARLLAEEVRIRIFLQGAIGSPAILFDGSDAAVLSGGNPLQLRLDRTEHATLITGKGRVRPLTRWFTDLWDSSHSASEVVLNEFEASWALYRASPFEVYMQMLHHLLGETESAEAETLLLDEPIFGDLTEFQLDAVRIALSILRKHSGCFVADVVGLGKSFIGTGILKYLERTEGARAVIVCPAVLVDMWRSYVDEYELGAKVISAGRLRAGSREAPAFELRTPELRDRDIVLIDESHMFRNAGTQRYQLMEAFLGTGRRVVMLTATPMNRSPRDLYHQIKLFHQSDRTEIPITPPHLEAFFRNVERGNSHLSELLQHILVRRTRRDILRQYGRDEETGERIESIQLSRYLDGRNRAYFLVRGTRRYFPRRSLSTVGYRIEASYRGFYREIRDFLAHRTTGRPERCLTYARYSRLAYVEFEHMSRYQHLRGTVGGLSGLIRTLLFKRLESSVVAFATTIDRMLQSNQRLIDLIEAGSKDRSALPLETEVDGDLAEELAAESEREVALEHMDRERFLADLNHDQSVLRQLADLTELVDPEEDAKLQELCSLLSSHQLRDEKVLVFTQFSDTAEYLRRELRRVLQEDHLGLCWSGNAKREEMVARFAPVSNPNARARHQGPELRVLVATDVLSEGVNLQDARVIVNYDLHWNPVRLIQRFGRLDRIGTQHDEILAFNFLPELELERNLGLRERLANRIQEIHLSIGEDTAILDPSEQLNERAMYAIYDPDGSEVLADLELGQDGKGAAVESADLLLRRFREESPDQFNQLVQQPWGLRACRVTPDREGVLVLLQAGIEKRLVWCDRRGDPEPQSLVDALPWMSTTADEPALPVPSWAGELIDQSRAWLRGELRTREGGRMLNSRRPAAQRTTLDQLRALEEVSHAQEKIDRIDLLVRSFSSELPGAVLRALRTLHRRELKDEEQLAELSRLALDYGLHVEQDRSRQSRELPGVRVVCSLVFVRGL